MEAGKEQSNPETKARRKRLVSTVSVRDHLEDYCQSTSIHGVKYLGEKGRPLGERLWWLFIFIFSFVGNFYLIGKVWSKWNQSPVIVSFAETTTPVWQVPFPAITVCSETKSRARVFNFTEAYYSNSTDEELVSHRADVSLLCDNHVIVEGGPEFTNRSTVDFLREVSPLPQDLVYICLWEGKVSLNCTQELFSEVMTDEGVCYTFNMLAAFQFFRGYGVELFEEHSRKAEVWTLEEGYPQDASLDTYPYRALTAGAKAGLGLVLTSNRLDYDPLCRGPVEGYKILLHNPAEIPRVSQRYLRVPPRQELLVAIQPNIMTTNEGLRVYSPSRRQCFFPSERYLAHFQVYTQRNCELECLTNHTFHSCGCVALYMPKNESTPFCGSAKKQCVITAIHDLRTMEMKASFKKEDAGSCNCLPACTSIKYEAETNQADFNWESVLGAYNENSSEFEGVTMSRVTIYFKDMQFVTSRRSELFGIVDFLANCGGLLGLFSGVSLLSIVEIIYYATLRFWSNLKRHHRKAKEDKTNGSAAPPSHSLE